MHYFFLWLVGGKKLFFCQDLEEPGEDTSRYDTFMPTVVRPKKPDLVTESENMNSADVSVTDN